ncbi:MAG: glycosyltransferase family 9 protein, partial [Kangiellaceae bacterium]|nr:glycosyltransferase family 9 protein [Kangiellaceae bacterium]
ALRKRRFDILLHMQVALRASLATLFVRAQEKWGFDKRRAREGQWLFTNKRIKPQINPHVVDGCWGFALALGVDEKITPKWHIPIGAREEMWSLELTKNNPYIVISPAASKAERNWLVDRYAAIAEYATSTGFDIYLSGGQTEKEKSLATDICAASNVSINNLTGQTSLPQLLALIKNAKLVLSPDSGPCHMATMVNTPVIGMYAHSNFDRTGPYLSRDNCVSVYEQALKEQTGKNISQNRWGKRVEGDKLMQLISIGQVKQKFDQIVGNQNRNEITHQIILD